MEEWQYKQIESLKKIIQPDWRYIDIGGARGEMLQFFVSSMSGGYAFEPQPENHYYLTQTFKDVPDLEIIQKAVADTNEIKPFWRHPHSTHEGNLLGHNTAYHYYDDSNKIDVECVTLDTFLSDKPNINLIKIDVEGSEWQIFNGAQETLKSKNIVYQVEFHLDEDWNKRDILYDNGYQIYDLFYNKLDKSAPRIYQSLLIKESDDRFKQLMAK